MGQYIGHFTRAGGHPAVTIEFSSYPTKTYVIPEREVPRGANPGDVVFVTLGPPPHRVVALQWGHYEKETESEWIDIGEFLDG